MFVAGAVPDRPSTMVIGLAGIIFASSIILRIFRQPTAVFYTKPKLCPARSALASMPFPHLARACRPECKISICTEQAVNTRAQAGSCSLGSPASTSACRSSDLPSSRLHLHRQINVGPNRELGPQVNGCQPGMMRRCLLFRNRFTSRKPQNVRLTPLCATRRRLFGLSASARSDGGRS